MKSRILTIGILFALVAFFGSCGSTDSPPEPEPVFYDLSVTLVPEEGGTVDKTSGSFEEGTRLTIEADANTSYQFNRWSGTIESDENPLELTFNSDILLEAEFIFTGYELNIEVEGEGIVNRDIVQQKDETYDQDVVIEISAVPAEGWEFLEWRGDLEGNQSPEEITMDDNKNITAVFTRKEFSLDVTTEGEGAYSIDLLSGTQTESGFLFESELRLIAESAEDWVFAEWGGDISSSEDTLNVKIEDHLSLTALFEIKGVLLTVTTEGDGEVDQQVVQGKNTNYDMGTFVELTAQPAYGWYFEEWQGDLTGDDNPAVIELNAEMEVLALFQRKSYALELSFEGEGAISSELISGEESESGYLYESVVQLTAEPETGWEFTGWSGDIETTENPVSVTILEDQSVSAIFEPIQYDLTVDIEGEGTVNQEVLQQKTTGYSFGTIVRLSAVPETGWTFTEWSGDVESTASEVTITMDEATQVKALFERNEYTLTVSSNGSGNVTETLQSGTKTDDGYLFESLVELEAIPEEDWQFTGWSGDLSGTNNPETIEVNQDIELTAEFQPFSVEYSIDLVFEDSKGTFEMQFGQASDPASLRRLAPPPPPAGALNAYFVYDGENFVRDFRIDSETEVVWELHYEAGDGENLTLSWNLNSSGLKGSLVLTNDTGDVEIDMLEKQSFDLSDQEEGVLKIIFEFGG